MADEAPAPEPRIGGIGRGEFQGWLHHPVTAIVLQFLRDKQRFYKDLVIDRFVAGTLDEMPALRGQVIELEEIEKLQFDHMVMFYTQEGDGENGQPGDDAAGSARSE